MLVSGNFDVGERKTYGQERLQCARAGAAPRASGQDSGGQQGQDRDYGRPLDRLHAGRRRALPPDRQGSRPGLHLHRQGQPGGRGHGRHGGAGPGRHRPARRHARDGGQGHPLQGVRGHRRLPDLPGHQGPRRDRRDRQAHRSQLRRHQPGGHLRAALLRD